MINYEIIAGSVEYYTTAGFQRIESPWTVTPQISNITKPDGRDDFTIAEKGKVLVASGEQSFLYLYNKGFIPKGQYQTITPCFRDEQFTPMHTKYFIKNELIKTDVVTAFALRTMVRIAKIFFEKYLGDKVEIVEMNGDSFDIEYRGTELGSYGIRQCDFLQWIYGTGVAEPRLSRVMERHGISH